MQYKTFSTPGLDMSSDGHGTITGYASVFTNFDSVGERVVKGAFTESLAEFKVSGFVAVGHNWAALPIATPVEAVEDDHGLKVTAAFHSTREAQDARTVIRERIERGKSVKLSIGYEVLDATNTKEGRLLNKLRLYEWSYVTVPANQLAMVTDAKAWSASDLSFSEHSERVASAVEEFVHRATKRTDVRLKAGRILSDANERAIEQAVSALQELLDRSRASRTRETAEQPQVDEKMRAFLAAHQALLERIGSYT